MKPWPRAADTKAMRTLSPTPVRLLSAALSRCDLDAPPAPATRSAATGTRETSLHHVLSGEALQAVFQPLVELTSGEVVGYEALKDEWSVVVLAPHFAGALVAVDLGDTGPDDERRFDFALTYDRDLVMDAASSLMRRVQPLA